MTPTPLFLGIDGGGSQTRALLIDANGIPQGSGLSSGSNPHNNSYADAAQKIDEATRLALTVANANENQIVSAFLGIAGIRDAQEQALLASELTQFEWARLAQLDIDHDLSIAYRAALGSDSGICLICGTGSSCFGKDPRGNTARASGRALDSFDPGSAFAIGMSSIKKGLCSSTSNSRDAVAQLAKRTIQLASEGNSKALAILEENANALVTLVKQTHSQLNLPPSFDLAIVGGLGAAQTLYRELLIEKIRVVFSQARVRIARQSPSEAAADWALANYRQSQQSNA